MTPSEKKLLPNWFSQYKHEWLYGDFVAGLIVTIMLIPQSLAYALLAGLPPEIGLYASILPMVAYALFGSSMTLAVGPVAVASLMTASALAPMALTGSPIYVAMATQLAFLSGVMLFAFGVLRFGFLAHLLSHPVISGFITGSAILITIGQLKNILGVKVANLGVFDTLVALSKAIPETNITTLIIGLSAITFLFFARKQFPDLLSHFGVKKKNADLIGKLAPMMVVIVSTIIAGKMNLHVNNGLSVVGHVPGGIPNIKFALPGWEMVKSLWLPALLISVVGFVESVSVAQSLAMRRQQRINPDRELLGLGAANVASALSGGYPVTGGFARSVVNFSAGANTPLAGVISAVLMGVVLFEFTEYFSNLPQAVLSATIIVAVLGLVDLSILKETWRYDKADAVALISTCIGVIVLGVEQGILIGVVFSLATYIWRASRPHIAIVGRVPGTEHFRNVERHEVETSPSIISIRVDENLFFGNVQAIEELIYSQIVNQPDLTDVLLIMSAVNRVDSTALMILEDINRYLKNTHKRLHLAEVHGPIMDRLKQTELLNSLTGECFLNPHEAYTRLNVHPKLNCS